MGIYLVEIKEGAAVPEDAILDLGEHGTASPVFIFSAASAEDAVSTAVLSGRLEGVHMDPLCFNATLLAVASHQGRTVVLRVTWDLAF